VTKRDSYAKLLDDRIDRVMVLTLYMIRHSDQGGLAILEEMRVALREAVSLREAMTNPTAARSKRIAHELAMTGEEQELPL
jgi:hypothetical protein